MPPSPPLPLVFALIVLMTCTGTASALAQKVTPIAEGFFLTVPAVEILPGLDFLVKQKQSDDAAFGSSR